MKKLLITFIIIAGVITFAEASKTKNLLKNGTFEKLNSKGVPTFWLIRYVKTKRGTAKIEASKEQFKSSNSVAISCEGDNDAYFAINQSIKGFAPNDKLTITAYIYIEEFNSGSIAPFYFSIIHGKKTAYRTLLKIKPANCEMNKWVTYKSKIDLSKYKDIKSLLFWVLILKGFEGKIFIDNVSITKQK